MSIDPSTQPWGPDTSWGSYMPVLMAALAQTTGPVLEIGVGHWSTPTLHHYCRAAGRDLASIEGDPQWCEQFKKYESAIHSVWASPDYQLAAAIVDRDGEDMRFGVVFIDNSPGSRRAQDALRYKDSADFIIVHDWSAEEISKPFEPILNQWKYRTLYTAYTPYTMVLSNTRELVL